MRIIIEEYNPDWKKQFEKEKQILHRILSGIDLKIEHVGSTSVNGLGAKPIIDIMIGLANFNVADWLVENMSNSGYEYISKYENIFPHRRYFIKIVKGKITHQIHMVAEGGDFWKRTILFRDQLRKSDEDRRNYFEHKKKLSEQDWNYGNDYADAKSEFIRTVVEKAIANL
ncbi:MAG: GrpB family protein [Bacteroidota bacterium]|nr:GrpB family protein [Bacteroidota bacterium]